MLAMAVEYHTRCGCRVPYSLWLHRTHYGCTVPTMAAPYSLWLHRTHRGCTVPTMAAPYPPGEWLGNRTAADQLTASVLALRQESASIGAAEELRPDIAAALTPLSGAYRSALVRAEKARHMHICTIYICVYLYIYMNRTRAALQPVTRVPGLQHHAPQPVNQAAAPSAPGCSPKGPRLQPEGAQAATLCIPGAARARARCLRQHERRHADTNQRAVAWAGVGRGGGGGGDGDGSGEAHGAGHREGKVVRLLRCGGSRAGVGGGGGASARGTGASARGPRRRAARAAAARS